MLTLNDVTKRFRNITAVNQLSLACNDQEFLVIFGPAGAGKSTTLRLIAGISPLTEGDILVNGESFLDVAPEHRNMAMAFENYALYSHLTVFENLAFPLRAQRVDKTAIKRRVHEMAELLQITPLLDRRPGFMSGGQRQRVALGRALIRDADFYLLDEPISHLDAKLRHHMRGQLKAICAQREATVIYVTHDYKEAMALSDRIAVLSNGQLLQIGPPLEVYHRPKNEFVAGFLGDPPMSFLDAELRHDEGSYQLSIGAASVPVSDRLVKAIEANNAEGKARVGARATDLAISTDKVGESSVPVDVYVVETFGYRNIVSCQIAGGGLVQSVADPAQKLAVEQQVWLNLNENNIHVFGADGNAISHPNANTRVV